VLAVIAGSAAHEVLEELGAAPPSFEALNTPFGLSSPLTRGALGEEEIVVLARHGAHGYQVAAPFVNYRANVWALKAQGVTEIMAWSGPGAIDDTLTIGQYIMPDDVLDETKSRPSTFYAGTGLGVIRQSPVFCPRLSAALASATRGIEPPARVGATYACTEGPRLETPAEIRKCRILGAHVVGMTLCPEVFLARELEICYAAILYVTNYAEGVKAADVRPERLFGGLLSPREEEAQRQAVSNLPAILARAASVRSEVSVKCACQKSMERYRRSSQIGDDWRQWTKSG
jgi:5'-methylthioadenosine phosphorylase